MARRSSLRAYMPVLGAALLSGCSAAQMEEARTAMEGVFATGPALPSNGISEAAAKAQGVQVGQIVQGSMDTPAELDTYSFKGTEGKMIFIFTQGLANDVTQGNLEIATTPEAAPIGAVWITSNAQLADTHTSRIELRETGTYTIRVNGRENAPGGAYRFQILEVDPRPENVPADVVLDRVVQGEDFNLPKDIDEFTLHGMKGQKVVLHTQGLANDVTQGSLELRVAGSASPLSSVWITSNAYLDDTHSAVVTLPETGTYTVRAEGRNGPYRFVVREMR